MDHWLPGREVALAALKVALEVAEGERIQGEIN